MLSRRWNAASDRSWERRIALGVRPSNYLGARVEILHENANDVSVPRYLDNAKTVWFVIHVENCSRWECNNLHPASRHAENTSNSLTQFIGHRVVPHPNTY
jgi:hypothetical protein